MNPLFLMCLFKDKFKSLDDLGVTPDEFSHYVKDNFDDTNLVEWEKNLDKAIEHFQQVKKGEKSL